MKFSSSIEYAIHGLVFLTGVPAGRAVQLPDVAGAINVPESYLRKVFQQLTRGGVLGSQRGAHGGFFLLRGPDSITLKDIVEVIDGSLPAYGCIRERRQCGITLNCPVKNVFEEARAKMAEVLDATTIKDLRDELESNRHEVDWLSVGV